MQAKQKINFLDSQRKRSAKLFVLKEKRIYSQVLLFFGVALVLAGFFEGANLAASGYQVKNTATGSAVLAMQHLQEAQNLVQNGQLADSEQEFEYAKDNFLSARNDINGLGAFVNAAISILPKEKAASDLLDAGLKITDAGINLNKFYSYTSQIKVTGQGFDSPDGFFETLTAARIYLDSAQKELADATATFNHVDPSLLPANLQSQFSAGKDKLDFANSALTKAGELLSLTQGFIGPGQKTILVLFENNNELRPTGGFIGTYGIFKLNDGKILSQKVTSVYDLDGQLPKIAPPGQLHDLTDHWGLRDSNWFPDFADSAQKASLFYEKAAGETPDAVIAVTPDLFVDLLRITGPIAFPKYGLTLSADNFRLLVQENTSDNYDKDANTPKQLLADFEPLLLQQLSTLPKDKLSAVASALIKDLGEKNLIFYDRDPAVEAQFQQNNWAGRIAETNSDYLAVFNANLGGQKTDLSFTQKMQVNSEVQLDGSIIDTVTYTRTHQTNLYDNAKNIDFARFLVPQGSTLISAQGFINRPYYHSDGREYLQDKVPFQVDSDLAALDANSTIDAASGTIITKIEGKTSFGNWIETAPGETSVVTLQYRLPFTLNDTRQHSFIFQKQPGLLPIDFSYSFMPHRTILWMTPNDLKISGEAITLARTIDADLFIGDVTQNAK